MALTLVPGLVAGLADVNAESRSIADTDNQHGGRGRCRGRQQRRNHIPSTAHRDTVPLKTNPSRPLRIAFRMRGGFLVRAEVISAIRVQPTIVWTILVQPPIARSIRMHPSAVRSIRVQSSAVRSIRARIPSVPQILGADSIHLKNWVRAVSIQGGFLPPDGRNTNPRCADGRSTNPGCANGRHPNPERTDGQNSNPEHFDESKVNTKHAGQPSPMDEIRTRDVPMVEIRTRVASTAEVRTRDGKAPHASRILGAVLIHLRKLGSRRVHPERFFGPGWTKHEPAMRRWTKHEPGMHQGLKPEPGIYRQLKPEPGIYRWPESEPAMCRRPRSEPGMLSPATDRCPPPSGPARRPPTGARRPASTIHRPLPAGCRDLQPLRRATAQPHHDHAGVP